MSSDSDISSEPVSQVPPTNGSVRSVAIGGLGFAASLLWMSVFSGVIDAGLHGYVAGGGTVWVGIGFVCLAIAIYAFRSNHNWKDQTLRRVDAASGAVVIMCSLALPLLWNSLVGLVMAALCACVAESIVLLRWGEMLSRLDARRTLAMVGMAAVSLFLAKALINAVGLTGEALALLLGALGIASWAGLRLSMPPVHARGYAFYTRRNIGDLVGVVVFMALFSVVLRLIDVIVDRRAAGVAAVTVALIVFAAVAVWLVVLKRPLDFFGDVRALFVITSCAACACIYGSESIGPLAAGVIVAIRELTRFYLFLLQADITRNSDVPSFSVFGIGWACCGIPRLPLCFFDIDAAVAAAGPQGDGAVLSALLLLVVACMAFSLVKPPSGLRPPFSSITPNMVASGGATIALKPTEGLSERYGLTAREAEILALVCAGRTRSYIADTLYISENTVKFHTKNVYRKTGVTSKQELIDLYEDASKDGT